MDGDRFFWFDPFGAAPEGAVVTGTAGGPIWWGSGGSYPELLARAHRTMSEQFMADFERSSRFIRSLRRREQDPPAGFQLRTGEPPSKPDFTTITYRKHIWSPDHG